jgi:peptidoglycan/xylan/chitin deacetylase (PgdA/CDA1 family)
MSLISGTYPVLMYHKVGQPVTGPQDIFLNISAGAFRRHIEILLRLGYQARTFGEVGEALARGQTLPRRTIAITFDDSYRCVEEVAAPILAEYALPATLFAVSKYVGATNGWDVETAKPVLPLMDWDGLRRLSSLGWEIGNHTHSHPQLGWLDDADAIAEIEKCNQEIEAALDVKVRSFCYPYGHLNERTPNFVRASGLQTACTMRSGLARSKNDPFLQPRVKVYGESVFDLLSRIMFRPLLPEIRRRRLADRPLPRRYA